MMAHITFHKMNCRGTSYYINSRKVFSPYPALKREVAQDVYDFAYSMTFGKRGKHRDHRSGGSYNRKPGEIFKDTFQGKLSECALYSALCERHEITKPSFDVWTLGKWDSYDFFIDNQMVSVKSTKAYGNLLLLETKDFDANGIYLPNVERGGGQTDFFVLVRLRPFCEDILKNNSLLCSTTADYNKLKDLIVSQKWEYDIPGYITRNDLQTIIHNKFILPRNSKLNGGIKIDADNYYIQAGDLRPITTL